MSNRHLQAPWVGQTPEEYDSHCESSIYCKHCAEKIYFGENYYDIDGITICDYCIDEYKKIMEEIYDGR